MVDDLLPLEEAVHAAMDASSGPVVLADLGDSPSQGGSGDGTALLWALIDLGAANAALAVLSDREAVALAHQAGVGARISTELGGKTDERFGYPIPVTATVRSLFDEASVAVKTTIGRSAVLACDGRHGNVVEVIVSEQPVEPDDPAIFRLHGIEPMEKKILAVKAAEGHFEGFRQIASRIIRVTTPGLTGDGSP